MGIFRRGIRGRGRIDGCGSSGGPGLAFNVEEVQVIIMDSEVTGAGKDEAFISEGVDCVREVRYSGS